MTVSSQGSLNTITVLGSGTGVPWRGRSAPGYAIEVEREDGGTAAILVDPGAGSIHRMARCGLPLERLSHVLFSHLHPDHVGDLVPLLFALKHPSLARRVKLPVFLGPAGLKSLYQGVCEVFGTWVHHGSRLEIREFRNFGRQGGAPELAKVGPLEVTAYPTEHTENSLAFRFESRQGKVFTYTGDTDYCQSVIDAARNAHLLVTECSFPEGKKVPGHLIPSEVGRIAAAAGVKHVVMTHLYPECQGEDLITPCRKFFSGRVDIAEDGLSLRV